jgi:hypothetical protein
MKKFIAAVGAGYVILALAGRAKEAAGLLTCDCYPDCWCKKPSLSLVRWVFPRFHHIPEVEVWRREQFNPSP